MARKTSTPAVKPIATKSITPRGAETVAYNARGLVDTKSNGVVGNLARGWETYGDPGLTALREQAHEERKAALVAYFAAQLKS